MRKDQFIKYWIGRPSIATSSYCAEATALFARMDVQPSDALKTLINDTILILTASSVWNKLDAFYIRAVHSEQAALLNWIKDAHNCTLVNTPTFFPYHGIWCNSLRSINTNLNVLTATNWAARNYTTAWMDSLHPSQNSYAVYGRSTAPQFYWYNYTSSMRGYYLSSNYMPWLVTNPNELYSTSFRTSYLLDDYNDQYLNGAWYYERWQPQGAFMDYNLIENDSGNGTRFFSAYGASLTAAESAILYNAVYYFKSRILNLLNYGNELILNGGFDTDTDWTKSTASWTINGGVAHFDNVTTGSYLRNETANNLVLNTRYKLTFTISNCATYCNFILVNHVGTLLATEFTTVGRYYKNGTYEFLFYAATTTRFRINAAVVSGGSAFDIDNVSIKEVL